MQVKIIKIECQKISFTGEAAKEEKYNVEYFEGLSNPKGKTLNIYENAIPANTL